MSTVTSLFTQEAFQALRTHPQFRAAIEEHAARSLAQYSASSLLERWLVSDLGRAALTGAALVLDAMPGGLTPASLMAAAQVNRTCSRGRVVAYLRRATLEGFFAPAAAGEARLQLTDRFLRPTLESAQSLLWSVSRLAPAAAAAAERLSSGQDEAFRRRFFGWIGALSSARRDLFNGPDMPVVLFLERDGGVRMLEHLILSQSPDRAALLERASLSRSALARSSFASRTHVARLLAEGQARGMMHIRGRELHFTRLLSEDVERHYAAIFELSRVAAAMALKA